METPLVDQMHDPTDTKIDKVASSLGDMLFDRAHEALDVGSEFLANQKCH